MESVIVQLSGTVGALAHGSVLLASKPAYKAFSSSGRLASLGSSRRPFVIRDSLQALPHPTSVRASVVRFHLSPVLTLCVFDGSLEELAGFLISVRISVPLLESGSSSL
jgi:hypothetical protein